MGEKRFSGVSFLMNLVFPPRCRCCQQLSGSKLLCEACATGLHEVGGNPCRFCGRDADRCRCDYGKNLLFERAVSAYYYEGTGRTLLQNFKFKGDRACYDQILSRRFLERTASAFSGVPFDYIVPVPMYEREKDRFDQTLYLARSLSRKMGIPCRTDLLRKVQKTPPQHLQKAKDRGENVKGACLACKKNDLQGVCILLVDDVATTFSTLNACTAALIAAGADRVLCACLMTTAGRTKNQGDAK